MALCLYLLLEFQIDSFGRITISNWNWYHQPFRYQFRTHLSCPGRPRSCLLPPPRSYLGDRGQGSEEDLCVWREVARRYMKEQHTGWQSRNFRWCVDGKSLSLVACHLISKLSYCGLPVEYARRSYHHRLDLYRPGSELYSALSIY